MQGLEIPMDSVRGMLFNNDSVIGSGSPDTVVGDFFQRKVHEPES